MKKLMIALAAVAMAAGVQAANVNWRIAVNSAEVGNNMYVVLASDLTGKDLSKLTAADVTGNALDWYGSSKYYDASPIKEQSGRGTTTYTQTSDASLTASDASVYLIAVTAAGDKYAIVGDSPYDVSGKLYNDGGISPGNFSVNAYSSALTYTAFAGDVPEPTSAMLLLLGMAGLALKRKVA